MAGVKIKFVDVNPETLNMDLFDLKKKKLIKIPKL